MTMITRCPACATTFRVTPAHLQAHGGKVRCGRCATVFDGFRDLATLPAAMPAEPAATPRAEPVAAATPTPAPLLPEPAKPVPAGAPPVEGAPVAAAPAEPVTADVAAEPVIAESPAGLAEAALATAEAAAATPATVEPGPEATESAETQPAVSAAVENAVPGAAMPEDRPAESPAAEPVAAASPALAAAAFEFEKGAEPVRRPRRPWFALAVLALLALGAQALYFFRGELSAQYPALRPTLAALCAMAGCTVALPQRPDKINIEASDLQAPDPAHPGLIVLTATLRNHAGIDVGYPALDIVLTNTKDHTVARRIVLPAEYLDRGKDPLAGIPANGEFTVRLNLETGDLGAAGFRLDILAAPQP
jgi:predicted Zn finger-like uncharacterized protein